MGLVPIEKLPDELLPGGKQLIEAESTVSTTPTFLAVGVMRSRGGTATAGEAVRVSSAGRARKLFGEGSSVANQCIAFLAHNKAVECWALPLAEPSGGTAAVWTLPVSGSAGAAGALTRYINGTAVNVAVQSGEDANAVGAKIVAAINAQPDLPVEASFSSGDSGVTLTAHCKGQYVELRIGKSGTDPKGLVIGELSQTTAGAGLVSLKPVSAPRWNYFSTDIFDSQAIAFWQKELKERYSPNRQVDGRLFACLSGAVGDKGQSGSMIYQAESLNSPHIVLIPRGAANLQDSATIAALWAATAGGVLSQDPAANLRERQIAGFRPQQGYSDKEREELLKAGIASYQRDKIGNGYFERTVTSYNETPDGSRDTSYLDLFIVEVISRLRAEINLAAEHRFKDYKLAAVAGDYGENVKVMNAEVWKAFLVGLYQDFLSNRGWVQDLDGYIESISVKVVSKTRLEYVHEPRPIGNLLQTRGVLKFR